MNSSTLSICSDITHGIWTSKNKVIFDKIYIHVTKTINNVMQKHNNFNQLLTIKEKAINSQRRENQTKKLIQVNNKEYKDKNYQSNKRGQQIYSQAYRRTNQRNH